MRRVIVATLLAMLASSAQADLIRFDNPNQSNAASVNEQSLVDVGGIGFGARPRMLTLQTSPSQIGSSDPSVAGGLTGDAIGGANKSDTPTLGSLGWLGGSQVAIGYDSNQTGNSGITLNKLTVNLFNASNVLVASFSTPSVIQYTQADLDLQQGNGTGLFIFVLDSTERAEFNALNVSATWKVGLFADMGCIAGSPMSCQPSNDGADSFIAIAGLTPIINPTCPDCVPNPTAVPLPIAGAGLPGLVAGCLVMLGLHRRRRATLLRQQA